MATLTKYLTKLFKDGRNDEEVKSTIAKENLQNSLGHNKSKNTLLHYAAKWNNAVITQYLLELGSKGDAQNRLGKTALIVAVEMGGCKDTIEILIKAGASIFIRDKRGNSALEIFVSNGSWYEGKIGEILLRNYDFPNDNEKILDMLLRGRWYLYKIIVLRNADITKFLLTSEYSDSIIVNLRGVRIALRVATKYADVENVKLLLDYCNANVKVSKGVYLKTLSYVFFEDISERTNERIEILKMLLERVDSLINNEGKIDKLIAYFLIRKPNKEAIKLLLQHGLNLSAVDSQADTVVHLLGRNKNPGVMALLRGKNFDVNARNHRGETPLILAAHYGNAEAVEFLLEAGADTDAVDYKDLTAMCRALERCKWKYQDKQPQLYRDCVQALLEHNKDAQLVNKIFDFLMGFGPYLVKDLLLSHIALQEKLGTPVDQRFRDGIHARGQLKANFESIQQDLVCKVYKSITLLDLLTANQRKLELYLRNQKLYSKVIGFIKKIERYYFTTILLKRILRTIDAIEKRNAANVICKIMKIHYESFSHIGDEIASYLEAEDIKRLLNATQENDLLQLSLKSFPKIVVSQKNSTATHQKSYCKPYSI